VREQLATSVVQSIAATSLVALIALRLQVTATPEDRYCVLRRPFRTAEPGAQITNEHPIRLTFLTCDQA